MENANAVTDNKAERRFELPLGEGQTAFVQYEAAGEGALALMHTEVPEGYEGRGVGAKLIEGAFQILQAGNLKIIPTCSFVAAYLRRHPQYQSLVANETRGGGVTSVPEAD